MEMHVVVGFCPTQRGKSFKKGRQISNTSVDDNFCNFLFSLPNLNNKSLVVRAEKVD